MTPWPVGLRLVEVARAAGLDAEDPGGGATDGDGGAGAPDAAPDGVAPGTAAEYRFDAERTISAFGDHLARLHSVAVPEDVSPSEPSSLLDAARRRLDAGELSAEQLPAAYRHLPSERLVAILADGLDEVTARAAADVAVLSHGRPVLASFRFRRGTPLGFTDWAGIAVADRHRDLAIAANDVVEVFGGVVVPVLFDAYGAPRPDPLRLDWYALADALAGA